MHNNSFYVLLLLLSSSLLRVCFIVQHYGPSWSFRFMYRRSSVMAGRALFGAHAHSAISVGASLCVCATVAVAKWKMHTDRLALHRHTPLHGSPIAYAHVKYERSFYLDDRR